MTEATTQSNGINTEKLKAFVALKQQVKSLEAKAKAKRGEADELMEGLIEEFVEHGTKSMRIEDTDGKLITVSLQERIFAKIITPEIPEDATEEVADAIKRKAREEAVARLARNPRYKHLVKRDVNLQTLTSFIKEEREQHREIPLALRNFVEANPKPELRITKR